MKQENSILWTNMRVWKRERDSVWERECVCMLEGERECVCLWVWVCVWERECVCDSVCVCVCVLVCVCVCLCVSGIEKERERVCVRKLAPGTPPTSQRLLTIATPKQDPAHTHTCKQRQKLRNSTTIHKTTNKSELELFYTLQRSRGQKENLKRS